MTHQKIISLIQELHLVFDIVRLVDITNNTQYTLNSLHMLYGLEPVSGVQQLHFRPRLL